MDPKRNISTVVLESETSESDSVYLPVLLDITHPMITWPDAGEAGTARQQNGHLRLINDVRGAMYRGEDSVPRYYAPCSFNVQLPKDDGKTKSTATITIASVDGRIIEVIRAVPENVKCSIVALWAKIKNDDGTVRYIFSKLYGREFEMGGVSGNGASVQWTLDPDGTMGLNVPRDKGSLFRFPAIMKEN